MTLPLRLSSVSTRIRWLIEPVGVDPEQVFLFARYLDGLTVVGLRIIPLVVIVATALIWPTDAWVFADDAGIRGAFGWWRGGEIALFLAFYALTLKWRGFEHRRRRTLALYVTAVLSTAATGALTSSLGGLDHSYFYAIYTLVGLPLILFLPLKRRLALTALINAGYITSYFALHPEHLRSVELVPMLGVLATANAGYLMAGHLIYHLTFVNWQQNQAAQTQAKALEAATGLTQRVLALTTADRVSAPEPALHRQTAALMSWEPLGFDVSQPQAHVALASLRRWVRSEASRLGLMTFSPQGLPAVVAALTSQGGAADAVATLAQALVARAQATAMQVGVHLDIGSTQAGPSGAVALDPATEARLRTGQRWDGPPGSFIHASPQLYEQLGSEWVMGSAEGPGEGRWLTPLATGGGTHG